MIASPAIAEDGPYNIDGVVPDAGTTEITDDFGNVKELGPLNSNTTKIGVIHDDAVPTLGSTNPNAQVDLRRAWLDTAKDLTTGDDWLYFAWERDKNTGSGFIAYEFMQEEAPAECDYENATEADLIANCNPWANRTDGDFMILWDQQGGSLDLYLRVWDDSSGTLLLGAPMALDATVSQAAYSADGFRGEAAVNLTDTIFGGVTGCLTFANTIPSTVTGNSDTADYKDTILQPTPPISNCGTVTIRKETVPDEDPNTTLFGFDRNFTVESDAEPPVLEFDLTDDGVQTWDDVFFGTDYVVDESDIPAGWALDSIDCSASTGYEPGDIVTDVAAGTVSFDLTSGQTVDCTYTNVPQTGSLLIVKERKHAADGLGETHPHEGVGFTVTGGNLSAPGLSGSTDADGELCFDGLVISSLVGDYTVTETVPDGYVSDDSAQDVSIVVGPDCADEEDPVTVSFLNTPLTDVTVSVNSQVDGGTFSSIECDVAGSDSVSLADAMDDPSITIEDLEPRTVVCTIVIDP
ncbi:MSCRAMM family protein [Agromyces sp. ZXT2-3]|uniref:MSCRAMM family protein n=1 Tax=Agromyces sp. ZXT2-3 TaxID=3461152 RepID=UPI0040553019